MNPPPSSSEKTRARGIESCPVYGFWETGHLGVLCLVSCEEGGRCKSYNPSNAYRGPLRITCAYWVPRPLLLAPTVSRPNPYTCHFLYEEWSIFHIFRSTSPRVKGIWLILYHHTHTSKYYLAPKYEPQSLCPVDFVIES